VTYKKTEPTITYSDFLHKVKGTTYFSSLTGKAYQVTALRGDIMSFIRIETGEEWKMDLSGVHRAYLELDDFKTVNFKPYVNRTHSPALGLLLSLGLLKRN